MYCVFINKKKYMCFKCNKDKYLNCLNISLPLTATHRHLLKEGYMLTQGERRESRGMQHKCAAEQRDDSLVCC